MRPTERTMRPDPAINLHPAAPAFGPQPRAAARERLLWGWLAGWLAAAPRRQMRKRGTSLHPAGFVLSCRYQSLESPRCRGVSIGCSVQQQRCSISSSSHDDAWPKRRPEGDGNYSYIASSAVLLYSQAPAVLLVQSVVAFPLPRRTLPQRPARVPPSSASDRPTSSTEIHHPKAEPPLRTTLPPADRRQGLSGAAVAAVGGGGPLLGLAGMRRTRGGRR